MKDTFLLDIGQSLEGWAVGAPDFGSWGPRGRISLEVEFSSLSLTILGRFSRRQIDDIFLTFTRKLDMTLHTNCLLRQFVWSIISNFLGKKKKNISNCCLLKIWPSMQSVNCPQSLSFSPFHQNTNQMRCKTQNHHHHHHHHHHHVA